jgi:hypothetical protein
MTRRARRVPPYPRTQDIHQGTVVEEGLGDLFPTAESRLDFERFHRSEVGGVAGGHLGVAGAIEVPRDDLLRLGRVEKLEVGVGGGDRAALFRDLVDDGDGEL